MVFPERLRIDGNGAIVEVFRLAILTFSDTHQRQVIDGDGDVRVILTKRLFLNGQCTPHKTLGLALLVLLHIEMR
jgi:hypothetical protein